MTNILSWLIIPYAYQLIDIYVNCLHPMGQCGKWYLVCRSVCLLPRMNVALQYNETTKYTITCSCLVMQRLDMLVTATIVKQLAFKVMTW